MRVSVYIITRGSLLLLLFGLARFFGASCGQLVESLHKSNAWSSNAKSWHLRRGEGLYQGR